MGDRGDIDREDWIDWVVRGGRAIGLDSIKLRWKLENWRRRWKELRRRSARKVEQVRYRHQICPECGALNSEDEERCYRCGTPLPSRAVQVVERLGGGFSWLSPTRLLSVLCVIIYIWVVVRGSSSTVLSLSPRDLIYWGGNAQWITTSGAWWRLATYMFLHAGIWHIAFNLLALNIVGPMAEQVYGPKRILLVFWLAGVVAGLASLLFTGAGVSIGASGSIMGLIGLVGTWGHRVGTPLGRHVRSQMIRWVIYIAIFGLIIGADNAAHAGGLVAGILLGFLLDPGAIPRSQTARQARRVAGAAGLILVLLTAAAIPLSPQLDRLSSLSPQLDVLRAEEELMEILQSEEPVEEE